MFSQKWDIPHPYRVSLYDSFYSKFSEGRLMGEGGARWFPAPFLQFKKIPREMTHTLREEGNWYSSTQMRWLCSHIFQGSERGRQLGMGLGPGIVQ